MPWQAICSKKCAERKLRLLLRSGVNPACEPGDRAGILHLIRFPERRVIRFPVEASITARGDFPGRLFRILPCSLLNPPDRPVHEIVVMGLPVCSPCLEYSSKISSHAERSAHYRAEGAPGLNTRVPIPVAVVSLSMTPLLLIFSDIALARASACVVSSASLLALVGAVLILRAASGSPDTAIFHIAPGLISGPALNWSTSSNVIASVPLV